MTKSKRKKNRLPLLLLLSALTLCTASGAATNFQYEPHVYIQNFENGELNAWSSYPPVQDTAYEAPFIHPGALFPGDEGTCLKKTLYPQSNNPSLTGAVKRLAMRLDASSRIQFRYALKTTDRPVWMGIDLPLADGGRIRARFDRPVVNAWTDVDLTLDDILSSADGEKKAPLDITAIAITFRFNKCDTDMPIVLGLDDFRITGRQRAKFTVTTPETTVLDEWESAIVTGHYHAGDTLEISVSTGTDIKRADVTFTRFDAKDMSFGTQRMKRSGNVWRFAETITGTNFPPGLYEARIRGLIGKETTVETLLTFTVIDDRNITGHPRLWFTRDTLDAFRKRLTERHPDFLEYIRKEALSARENLKPDMPYDLDYFPKTGWLSSFGSYRTRIATIPSGAFTNALVYALDDDREAAEWAKTALVNLCRWPTWTHPWMRERGHHIYLYVSYATRELALAYDILYETLTDEERRIVCDAFIRNGLEPAYRTYVKADMVTNQESNWITAIVGGALAGGCAIIGDVDETSALEPYMTGCLMKLRAHINTVYGGDSGMIEGFSYGLGTIRHYAEYLPVYEQTLGLDFSDMFMGQCDEVLWAGDHEQKRYFTFGDARVSGGNAFSCFPWLVEKLGEPSLAWLMDKNPPTPAPYTLHTVLADTDDAERIIPDLTGSRLFKTTGTAVFRSGNGPEPFIFTFRAGPFGNHQHLDQGSFFLHDRGTTFITELGYSNYYDDPYYQSHVIQPIGHNCILVDGNPHSQHTGDHALYATGMDDHARITQFTGGKRLGWALGDLSPLYTGNVSSLTRGVMWIAPRTILVLDRLTSKTGEASMNALFHGPDVDNMGMANNTFEITEDNTRLTATVLLPQKPDMRIDPDVVKLAGFTNNPVMPTGRLTLTAQTSGGTTLSAVLMSTGQAPETISHVRGSALADCGNGWFVLVNEAHEMLTNGPIGSDGVAAALGPDDEMLIVEGTHGSINSHRIIHSDTPITALLEDNSLHYSTRSSVTVSVKRGKKPSGVIMNDTRTKNWRYDSNTEEIVLQVSPGSGIITFSY